MIMKPKQIAITGIVLFFLFSAYFLYDFNTQHENRQTRSIAEKQKKENPDSYKFHPRSKPDSQMTKDDIEQIKKSIKHQNALKNNPRNRQEPIEQNENINHQQQAQNPLDIPDIGNAMANRTATNQTKKNIQQKKGIEQLDETDDMLEKMREKLDKASSDCKHTERFEKTFNNLEKQQEQLKDWELKKGLSNKKPNAILKSIQRKLKRMELQLDNNCPTPSH